MRAVCLIFALILGACSTPACNISVHDYSPAEQKQMVAEETAYLPPNSILWPVIEECAGVRAQARQCSK